MTILSLLCRLIPGSRCAGEPTRPETTAAPTTSADLGQKEAKTEAQSKEQLTHMEGGRKARPAQQAKKPPR
jgi:hypothetical protein